MIGSVGGGNDILALLQARTAKKRPATGTPQTAKEAEAAKALEEKQQRSDELLRSLTQMTDSMKKERKAAAAQKVERLKKELENLRLFSGSGDPKAIARQAARIARELGAAAKEYSGTGGGAPVSVPSSSGASAEAAGARDAGAEDGAATAEGGENSAKAAASDAERVVADVEAEAGGAEQEAGGAEPEAEAVKPDTAKPLSPEQERAAFVDKLNAKLSETTRKSSEAEADKKFENEVRRLFAEAKAILELQRKRAADQNRDDNEFDQFAKDVEQAGKAIDQAFSGAVEPGLIMAQAPVNIAV